MMKQKGTARHWLVVVTCIVCNMFPTALTFNVAPTFYASVSESLDVSRGTFGIYMTCILLTCSIFLSFAGKILATKDARAVLSLSVAVVGLATVAMSFYDQVWMFYVSGVLIGLGEATLFFLAVPVMINRWFAEKAGFWLGVCMAFAGVGGFLFNLTTGQILVDAGWRMGYLVNGLLCFVALPFTVFCIRSNPAQVGLLPYGAALDAGSVKNGPAAGSYETKGVSKKVAFKSSAFVMVVCMTVCMSAGTTLYQYMASYASSLEIAVSVPTIGASIASAAMLGQAIAKPCLGIISDKSGAKMGLWVGAGLGLVSIAMFLLLGGAQFALIASGFIFGWFYATGSVQVPIVVREAFGSKDFAEINSRNAIFMSLTSAFGATIWGFFIDFAGFQAMWLMGAVLVVAMVVFGTIGLKVARKLPQSSSTGE